MNKLSFLITIFIFGLLIDQFLLNSIYCNVQAYDCHSAFQCYETSISTAYWVECVGYRSCDSSIINTSSSLVCDGGYSCFNSSSVTVAGDVDCKGLFSCADSILNGNILECYGEKSCLNAILNDDNANNELKCYAFDACMGSTIRVNNDVEFEGFFSGRDAVIYSHGSHVYHFQGTQSGYNAQLVCEDGDTCDIRCWDNNCNHLELINNGGTINVTCEYDAGQSNICPNGKQLSAFMYETPNLLNLTVSPRFDFDVSNNYDPCNTDKGAIHCDDARDSECDSQLINNNGTICCSGEWSCLEIIIVSNVTTSITSSEGTGVRCDADGACVRSTITAKTGDMYFTGSFTARDATIEATSKFDIFCSGAWSCYKSTMRNSKNVYCLAPYSCQQANISGIVNNIYLYGKYTGQYGNIENIGGSVFCEGYQSCHCYDCSYVISNVTGDIYASGYQSLYGRQIEDIGGSLLGFGNQALGFTTVNNVHNLHVDGTYCFDNSYINGVNNIKTNGTNSVKGSTILTNADGIFTMELYGRDTESFDVTCTSGDRCYIFCYERYSCIGMALTCHGNCFIDCDNEGNTRGCPTVAGNYSYYWNSSTHLPTHIPSIIPTLIPTANPTLIPTTNPTNTTSSTTLGVVTTITATNANVTSAQSADETSSTTKSTAKITETTETTETTAMVATTRAKEESSLLNTESSITIILVICLSVLCAMLICSFWLVCYFFFKQKAKSKTTNGMVDLNRMVNVAVKREREKERRQNKAKRMESIEFGNINGINVNLRSQSTSKVNQTGENFSDGESDDDSVSKLFDTTCAKGTGDNDNADNNNNINTPTPYDNKVDINMPKAARVESVDSLASDNLSDIDVMNANTSNVNVGESLAMFGDADDNINDRVDVSGHDSADAPLDVTHVTAGNDGGFGLIGSLDESKYQQWRKKDVLLWLKENLMNNGFEEDNVKSFLKEFSKMNIVGGTLHVLKHGNNIDKKFNGLRSEFSHKNQALGIWMVVQSCIENVGQHHD